MEPKPDTKPDPADATGCLLLGGSLLVCAVFGLMALGSYFPELVRAGFLITLVALVASAVLSAGLVGIADSRIRNNHRWYLTGENLDRLGSSLGVERKLFEQDDGYRKRIGAVLRGPKKP